MSAPAHCVWLLALLATRILLLGGAMTSAEQRRNRSASTGVRLEPSFRTHGHLVFTEQLRLAICSYVAQPIHTFPGINVRQLLSALCLVTAGAIGAQPSPQKAQVSGVVTEVSSAWNRHDMRAFAGLFAPDADFVNVGAMLWTGRAAIEKNHAYLHGSIDRSDTVGVSTGPATFGIFRGTTLTIESVNVRMVTPDVAIARAAWNLRGDARTSTERSGLFLFVLRRRAMTWQILTAQNTEAHRPPALDR